MEILCEVSTLDLRTGDIVLWEPNYPVFIVHPYIPTGSVPDYGTIVLREQQDRGTEWEESVYRFATFTVIRNHDNSEADKALSDCVNWETNTQGDCGGRVELVGGQVVCETCRNKR